MNSGISGRRAFALAVLVTLLSLSCQRVGMIDLTGGTYLKIQYDETRPTMALLTTSDQPSLDQERIALAISTYLSHWSERENIEAHGSIIEFSTVSTDKRLSRAFSEEDVLQLVIVPAAPGPASPPPIAEPILVPSDTCTYALDGECDEPSLCSAGTDATDCDSIQPYIEPIGDSCTYAKDGVCDEPANCQVGTDATDCRRSISTPASPPTFEIVVIPFSWIHSVRTSGKGDLTLAIKDELKEKLEAILNVSSEGVLQVHQDGTVLASGLLRNYYQRGFLHLPADDQDLLPFVGEAIRVEALKRDGAVRLLEAVKLDPPSTRPGSSKYPW